MRLKDIKQIANHATHAGQRVTVKLSDGLIYELVNGKVFDSKPQMGVINGKETEIRHFQPLSKVWEKIQTIKIGSDLVAIKNREGELILKRPAHEVKKS